MAKTAFLLIQSMSPAEKRYFKAVCQNEQQYNQNYLLLFDAIDSQSEYDETALKKRHAFVKQLHVTKII